MNKRNGEYAEGGPWLLIQVSYVLGKIIPASGQGSSTRAGSNRDEGSYHSNYTRFTNMDFPKFLGDDPTELLNRASQYFNFQEIGEEKKVALASFHLEREAN